MNPMQPFLNQISAVTRTLLLLLFSTSVICLLLPVTSHAESPEDIARRLQQTYDQIKSLAFDFNQNTEGELSGRAQQASGSAWFVKDKKPVGAPGISGKMRWDYTSPEKQILVSDGIDFSMYFAKLEQMIVSPAETMRNDITYSFFTGSGNLLKDFSIAAPSPDFTPGKEDTGKYKVIKLTPKEKQSQVSEIHLWVTPDSMIQRIDILDHFDTRTSLTLSNMKVNTLNTDDPKAMETLFTFTPPEGTEIIYQ
jgi:outer membrane lipoprotein carrier protein